MKSIRFFNDGSSVAQTHEPKSEFNLKRLSQLAPIALVLAACAPAVAPTQDVQSIVNTAVAQQAGADMATMQEMLQNSQPTLTPTPGAQNVDSTPSAIPNIPPVQTYDGQGQETQNQIPSISISGVPQSINHEDMPKWAETSDSPQGNTIGLGTQGTLREPGVRTVGSLAEEDQSAWSSSRSDVQKTFEQEGPSNWWAPEGGFAVFTGARMELKFNDINGNPIDVNLIAEPNHSFIVIVSNHDEDAATPNDGNLPIMADNFDPAFTMGTALPKGQFVSQDWFEQNVASAHNTNCGDAGCNSITAVMIDRSGAYTIINQVGNGPWTLVQTNIQ